MLHYMLSEDNELEVETFPTLLQALARIKQISDDCLSNEVTASIMFVRDSDGELFDVVEFSDAHGFEFNVTHEDQF